MIVRPISQKYQILYKKARYKVLAGGRGSGKSWAIAEALIYYALKYPQMRILCAREIQKSIKESSYQLLMDTAHRLGVGDRFEFIRDSIRVDNSSQFIFHGLSSSTEQSIKSLEGIHICWVEEAQTITQQSLDILLPTIRRENSQVWFSFNPYLPTDPIAVMFLGETLPPDTLLEFINYDDNPKISHALLADINHMKIHDPKRYQHVYRGGFVDSGDTKVFSLELVQNAIGRIPDQADGPVIAALDVARFGDDSSILTVKQGNRILSIKQWQGKSTTELTRLTADVIFQDNVRTLIIDNGGGHGSGPIDQLRELVGNICDIVEFHGAGKANDNRYANARAETMFLAKKWLETGSIVNNTKLVAELVSIEYKFTTNNAIIIEKKADYKKRMGQSPDALDSFAMLFYHRANSRKTNMKALTNSRGALWS